jgi:homoserine kinase
MTHTLRPASDIRRATAFAPGSIGNVGPGLDVLGLAVAGAGDVTA